MILFSISYNLIKIISKYEYDYNDDRIGKTVDGEETSCVVDRTPPIKVC